MDKNFYISIFKGTSECDGKIQAGSVTRGLASPDGRHLAIVSLGFESNVRMIENF